MTKVCNIVCIRTLSGLLKYSVLPSQSTRRKHIFRKVGSGGAVASIQMFDHNAYSFPFSRRVSRWPERNALPDLSLVWTTLHLESTVAPEASAGDVELTWKMSG